jgi:hypothetical protein
MLRSLMLFYLHNFFMACVQAEDPSKAIATEGSNNHALYPNDEVVLNIYLLYSFTSNL